MSTEEKQVISEEVQKLKNKIMAYTPFKMKGNPMQRNYGIGSPAKQRDIGGTKSEKGNIFTKRGRNQRKINKSRAETEELMSGILAENKRKTAIAVQKHKEKMLRKQVKNMPNTKIMQKDADGKIVDATDKYRSKSPAKILPLVAAIAPAVIGAMSKKKEEK
jgi:ElaB/YqjD/DUF883 family membrane-anchored ribosome-binding protein